MKALKILNPLGEDTSIMRTTILPSMLEIITRNYNYRNKAVRLYELGKVYFAREDGMADEPKILSLGAYGDGMDFFTLKGGIEAILRACASRTSALRPARTTPPITPAAAQRSMPAMSSWVCSARSTRSSRPPTAWTRRSMPLSCALTRSTPCAAVSPSTAAAEVPRCYTRYRRGVRRECHRRRAGGLHPPRREGPFEEGRAVRHLPRHRRCAGHKSVAFSLTLRADDRSLTGEEADEDVKSILALLEAELGAKLR